MVLCFANVQEGIVSKAFISVVQCLMRKKICKLTIKESLVCHIKSKVYPEECSAIIIQQDFIQDTHFPFFLQ